MSGVRRMLAVSRKELLQIIHDPRALVVAMLMPPLMIVLYGYGVNLDVKHLPLGVCDQDRSATSRELLSSLEAGGYFEVRQRLAGPREADHLLDEGAVRCVLWVPRGFEADLREGRGAEALLLVDGSDSNTAILALGYASGIVRQFGLGKAAARLALRDVETLTPIDLRARYWYNPELRSTNYVVPGLVVVVLMMLSALLTSATIVRERERGTIDRLRLSPLGGTELILGKLLPYAGISYGAVLLAMLAGELVFKVPVRGSAALLLLLTGLFLFPALGIGLLVSAIARSQQVAMVGAFLLTFLPAILLTGFVFPVERMPLLLRAIATMVPARHFLIVVRGIYLMGVGVGRLWHPVLALVGFAVVIPWLASLALRSRR